MFVAKFGEIVLQPVTGGKCALKFRRKLRYVIAEVLTRAALECEQVRQFLHLKVKSFKCLIATGNRIVQEELSDHEDHQQKDNDHEQGRERIDEAGPDIKSVCRATPCQCHGLIRLLQVFALRQGGNGTREQANFVANFLHCFLASRCLIGKQTCQVRIYISEGCCRLTIVRRGLRLRQCG